jgi:hypothetical protein
VANYQEILYSWPRIGSTYLGCMTASFKGSPQPSPWQNLVAFVAVLTFGILVGIASHWNVDTIISVTGPLMTLYGFWRFGPGSD